MNDTADKLQNRLKESYKNKLAAQH